MSTQGLEKSGTAMVLGGLRGRGSEGKKMFRQNCSKQPSSYRNQQTKLCKEASPEH